MLHIQEGGSGMCPHDGGEVVGRMYASTPIPPLGPSPRRPKQDKCLPEEEIEQEKNDLDKKKWKNRRELRIPT